MTAYTLAGLHLISEFVLPGATECGADPSHSNTVSIRSAKVAGSLSSVISETPGVQWDGERMLIEIAGAARYLVSHNQIDIEPLEGADPSDVRAYLLGTVFGALCHLRGIFPLHASAIEFEGGCVAFTGDSGAGKSTMIAALAAHGHPVITDDVSFIRFDERGNLSVQPGLRRLRLWESAMDGLGYSKEDAEREFRGYEKYLIPTRALPSPGNQRPLRCIYTLESASPETQPSIQQLRGAAAVEILLANTYRMYLAAQMGRKQELFSVCARASRSVPIFQLSRPKDFGLLPAVLDLVEAHMQDLQTNPTA